MNGEAISDRWDLNAYALVPVGKKDAQINSVYQAGSLNTYGLDMGFIITPQVNASVGYYYQHGNLKTADGSGVIGRLTYEMTHGLTAGVNLSYDEAFETRISGDLKVRIGGPTTTAARQKKWETSCNQRHLINAWSS